MMNIYKPEKYRVILVIMFKIKIFFLNLTPQIMFFYVKNSFSIDLSFLYRNQTEPKNSEFSKWNLS